MIFDRPDPDPTDIDVDDAADVDELDIDELDVDEDDTDRLERLRAAGLPVVVSRPPITGRRGLSPTAAGLLSASLAPATRTAYESSWHHFAGIWCTRLRGMPDGFAATPDDVIEYIGLHVQRGLSVSYLKRTISAINAAFDLAELPSPARHPRVRRALAGAVRQLRTRGGVRQAAPIRLDELRHLVDGLAIRAGLPPTHPRVRRDRALLLLGWYGALRQSELVALDVDDITVTGDPNRGTGGGLLLRLRQAKTAGGADQWVAVPYSQRFSACPVRSTLLLARTHKTGALFRSVDRHGTPGRRLNARAVTTIVRSAIHLVDPSRDAQAYSSHSLRAGWVTEARARDVPDHVIMRHTRHVDARMLTTYDRPRQLLDDQVRGGW